MTLAQWLSQSELTDAAFAERIGVKRQSLARYKDGSRIPRPAILAKIQRETEGHVTPNDFMSLTDGVAA